VVFYRAGEKVTVAEFSLRFYPRVVPFSFEASSSLLRSLCPFDEDELGEIDPSREECRCARPPPLTFSSDGGRSIFTGIVLLRPTVLLSLGRDF